MRDRLRRRPLLFTLVVGLVLAAGGASAEYVRQRSLRVTPATVAPHLAERLSADSLALAPGVHTVYAAQGRMPVWFAPAAREAALATLRRADRDALALDSALADLGTLADTAATSPSLAALDVGLTAALLRFGDALVRPRADAAALYGHQWTAAPPTPPDVAARLAEALAEAPTAAAAVQAWADGLRPQHPGYRRLRQALARELDLRDRPDLALDRDLAPGDSGAAIVRLRDRLAVEGLTPASETPRVFDAALAEAVRQVQRDRTLAPTGRLDAPTRAALNRRRAELIPLLALNLERWRWLPADLGDLHVWVNVPRFELAVRERAGADWAEATRFVTVVGAHDWETPAFTDTLETVVFSPTWTVPASIQRESYGRVRGRVVRPPGPGNAMGRVKFLFPNAHAVYVHDTPSKWAFGLDDRARSHGCVRAGDPQALARALLTRTNGWTEDEVAAEFRGRWRTRYVPVEATVPVHLVYFTAEVDPDGRLRVYDDVYRRDRRLADALGLDLPDLSPDVIATLIADAIGDEAEVEAAEAEESAPADPPAPPLVPVLPVPEDTTDGVSDELLTVPSDTAGTAAEGVLSRPARR
ncbi:L,D-transpeptidase family protein [Rubrivirga sp.]|uniref:L,D-transpeptidase family protein n=1 Tax=Rubrivirga sp. TaxID=1885344 RepID=UPI003B5222FD